MQRARDALADRLFAILAAARDASTIFYNGDHLPVAILTDQYGDDWVDPVADAAGMLAATMARAATVLTGALGSDLADTSTGPWAIGVLDDVRHAASEVIRQAESSTATEATSPKLLPAGRIRRDAGCGRGDRVEHPHGGGRRTARTPELWADARGVREAVRPRWGVRQAPGRTQRRGAARSAGPADVVPE